VRCGRALLGLMVLVSCAPPRAVDRGSLPADAGRPADRPADVEEADLLPPDGPAPPPDAAVDAEPPDGDADVLAPDSALDTTPDQPIARNALLVVGNSSALTTGDGRVQQVLAARSYTVRLASDEDGANVAGVHLVVLAESSAGIMLGDKYRDVAVPVLVLERAVFFEMGMTGNNFEDHGFARGTQLAIQMAEHPLAAGLTGTVSVVLGGEADLGWGRPAAAAQRVAIVPGLANQVAIFGYERGAAMVVGQALARRVGCFVMEAAASRLSTEGTSLLGAAIDWAVQ
jgi:hypothetical protein